VLDFCVQKQSLRDAIGNLKYSIGSGSVILAGDCFLGEESARYLGIKGDEAFRRTRGKQIILANGGKSN